jgi:hypothetical protein
MNRIILVLATCMFLFASCEKEVKKPLTKVEIQQRIDSMTKKRIQEVDYQAQKELEYRMKIEVKIKADSIKQALQKQ